MGKKKIEDIVDECLERMFQGQSIEDCLKAYPRWASELEPLLWTSMAFIQESADICPAPGFKDRTQTLLQAMFYDRYEKDRSKARIPIWRRKWATAVSTILIVLFAGVGVSAASANALPDGPLYPVKLATEQARLALAFSDAGKAELHVSLAERRAGEMVVMASRGEGDKVLMLAAQVSAHLNELPGAVEVEPAATDRIPAKWGEEETLPETPAEEVPLPPSPASPEEAAEGGIVGETAAGAAATQAPAEAPAETVPEEAAAKTEAKAGEETAEEEAAAYGVEKGELELPAALSQSLAGNLAVLRNALDNVPEEYRPFLEQAIRNMAENYDEAISLIESGID
ncbi:MAG: DUF5667 domain-containing protein [Chloroflexota bacterium]|nr:DUF5667 domain-containing protein [Chloroflexota bacterium]